MKLKRVLLGVAVAVGVVAVGGGAWVFAQTSACDASLAKRYDVPPPAIRASTDPSVIARGKHLAESVSACASSDCHGANLAGGRTLVMGPLGIATGPNITPSGARMEAYTDGELARVVRHGLRRDGTSLRFMPSQEIGWLPDGDLTAVVSYVRSVAPVTRSDGPMELSAMAKVLDRRELFALDVARRIDHAAAERDFPQDPAPTAAYGAFIGRGCKGCHGERLSGGPIPGGPPSMPVPLNLTPHATGLAKWSFEDFDKLLTTGVKPDGKKLDPFMPYESFSRMNDVEKRALWAYLQSVPPLPFGNR